MRLEHATDAPKPRVPTDTSTDGEFAVVRKRMDYETLLAMDILPDWLRETVAP